MGQGVIDYSYMTFGPPEVPEAVLPDVYAWKLLFAPLVR